MSVATLQIWLDYDIDRHQDFGRPPPATCHRPPASRLPVPGVCNSTGLLIEHAGAFSGGVEFSIGSFWPMENSEFVEALANRRL